MVFTCKRCHQEFQTREKRESLCIACNEDLDLLEKQSEINTRRIKKLEEHKALTEFELSKLTPEQDRGILLETMKRIKHNLQIEYDLRDGIKEAVNSKPEL